MVTVRSCRPEPPTSPQPALGLTSLGEPQSAGHEAPVSSGSQVPSPQKGAASQSAAQSDSSSSSSQTPPLQSGSTPQSSEQEAALSLPLQIPSPQYCVELPPHPPSLPMLNTAAVHKKTALRIGTRGTLSPLATCWIYSLPAARIAAPCHTSRCDPCLRIPVNRGTCLPGECPA